MAVVVCVLVVWLFGCCNCACLLLVLVVVVCVCWCLLLLFVADIVCDCCVC